MQVIIDPRLRFNYVSWYLLGIYKVFGKQNISFDVKPFMSISYHSVRDYNSGFAFIVQNEDGVKKIFIDTEDQAIIFKDRYEWCDIYGMVNPTSQQVRDYPKLTAIGPQFGISLASWAGTIKYCINLILKGGIHTDLPLKLYIRDCLYSKIRRRPLRLYTQPHEVTKNYIFHASTLWYGSHEVNYTNRFRGEFLKAAHKAGLKIEGGFYYLDTPDVVQQMPDYPKYKEEYKDFLYNKRLSMDDYIKKTLESVVVFNTPSVCSCHGWKLGEYLCMGKAIISTPLTRELPFPLEHGENIHFVSSTEELYDAIVKINTDEAYRNKLEKGAKHYYMQWLAPEKVIERLFFKVTEHNINKSL